MVTKRQLGIGFILVALLGAGALLAVDLVGAGDFQGIGPAQRLGLAGCALILVIGVTLLPLGDKPA